MAWVQVGKKEKEGVGRGSELTDSAQLERRIGRFEP